MIFIFWILNSITKKLINLKNLYKTSKYFYLTYNKKNRSYYNHMAIGNLWCLIFLLSKKNEIA